MIILRHGIIASSGEKILILSFQTEASTTAAFAGSGMTQTNVNNFTDRIETFMDAIGAGVIT